MSPLKLTFPLFLSQILCIEDREPSFTRAFGIELSYLILPIDAPCYNAKQRHAHHGQEAYLRHVVGQDSQQQRRRQVEPPLQPSAVNSPLFPQILAFPIQ